MPGKLTLPTAVGCLFVVVVVASHGAAESQPAPNNAFRASLISACERARRPRHVRALAFDGSQLPAGVAAGHEPGSRPRCRGDELRLLRFEALRLGGVATYVRRGGCALPCVVRQATVHVPARALASEVSLLPRSVRNGNGEPVAGCDAVVHNTPQTIDSALARMYYKTPTELRARRNAGRSGGAGARWSNYGDPGRTYSSPGGRRASYNYLLWNLPRTAGRLLPGGGIVRAVLREGQELSLCSDTRLTLPAFDRAGAVNGEVIFSYARVVSADARSYAVHGWVLVGYRYLDRGVVLTVVG
ncbi:MAG TPA: hypothetical protein VNA28_09470 [Solirubrobacteraceae bacterium]|nr:hypothetical protein [Solirubrobacteraceae bacterium]